MDEQKIKEAIERIRGMRNKYNAVLCSLPESVRRKSDYNNDVAALETAMEALEKQMSKKVDMRTEYRDLNDELVCFKGFCPNCGWVVDSYRNKSCNRCGQRLDWRE